MPKFYECEGIEGFEEKYRKFLGELLKEEASDTSYPYIDPDSREDVGKTSFYHDLTIFLNSREKEFKEKFKDKWEKYEFLPPKFALETTDDGKDAYKITVKSVENKKELFLLTSDQFGFSASRDIFQSKKEKYPLSKLFYCYKEKREADQKKIINRITRYVKNTRTLGSSFIWPTNALGNRRCQYNTSRGVRCYLEDRVDLALWELKQVLEKNCRNILGCQYNNKNRSMRQWLDHFGSFENYVEYFMLEPFCERKYDDKGSYTYHPINIIDGSTVNESNKEKWGKVRLLDEEKIINMLDRLEGMILIKTANMENVVRS